MNDSGKLPDWRPIESAPTADVINFPLRYGDGTRGGNRDIEIVENGKTVIAMASGMMLPDALRWAADVLEGKAKEPTP